MQYCFVHHVLYWYIFKVYVLLIDQKSQLDSVDKPFLLVNKLKMLYPWLLFLLDIDK